MKTRSLKLILPFVVLIPFIIIELNYFNYKSSISNTKRPFTKSAVAFQDTKGNSASPTITITDSHIKSVWSVPPFGCGVITHTLLNGPNGNYSLGEGDNSVNPGTYSLHIDGKVVQTSGTRCGYGKIQITLYYN